MVGASGRGQLGLLRAAHRGDHRGVGPPGELDGRVAHGTRAAGDEHDATVERARAESVRAAFGDREAAVCGEKGTPRLAPTSNEAWSGSENDAAHRDERVLLRRALGPLVGRLPDPHPPADQRRLDSLPHRVDHTGAVVVRRLRRAHRLARCIAAPRLPVGRVHARADDAHPHLAGAGLAQRLIDQRQNVGIASALVDDGSHGSDRSVDCVAAAEGLGESEAVDLLRMDADEGTVEFRTEAGATDRNRLGAA